MANECVPLFEPGGNITGTPTVAVVGKRLVKLSATMESYPFALNTSRAGGNIKIAPCGAGEQAIGVADRDAAIGIEVNVHMTPGAVYPILAGAAIDFDEEVQAGANGTVVPLTTGPALGKCLCDTANATDAPIKWYGVPVRIPA